MRIHIAGGNTSMAYNVAVSLSGRLGLDFMSADPHIHFPVSYSENEKELLDFWNTRDDCVVNALSIPVAEDDGAIHVLLTNELISEKVTPGAFLLQRRCEHKLYDVFNPEAYTIAINTTDLSVDFVVQHIIDCIIDGKRGYYLPVSLLLPKHVVEPCDMGDYRDIGVIFKVTHFYASYILEDWFNQAQLYARDNKLLRCNVFPTEKYRPMPLEYYAKWGHMVSSDNYVALLGSMLSKYCAKFSLYDADEAFCTLCQNGNPYNKLIEMGFDK